MECVNPGPKPIGRVYLHCLFCKDNNNLINKRHEQYFSFLAASNRYKHSIGGSIIATLADSFYAAIYHPPMLTNTSFIVEGSLHELLFHALKHLLNV